ncbi:MAG: hypothetical protein ACJAUH_000336 [Saprospiraceae bacterium]|jgi:hypothetical protein
MLEEDAQDEELSGKPYRFAKKFPINISPNTDGQWQTINNYKVWRYKMTSADAYAMMVILEEFNLTSSASLFVYNEDKSFIAGPYTSQYNNEAQILPIRLIPDENLTLFQYFQPKIKNANPKSNPISKSLF